MQEPTISGFLHMDLSYDRLLAQIRHEIAKFFLIHTSYFGRFGPNKIRLK